MMDVTTHCLTVFCVSLWVQKNRLWCRERRCISFPKGLRFIHELSTKRFNEGSKRKLASGRGNKMKITSISVIPDSEVPLRNFPAQWVFELEDGVIGEDGAVLCPTCRCCSLKQVPKSFPDLFGRPRELSVWVCSSGCTKTKSHAHRA